MVSFDVLHLFTSLTKPETVAFTHKLLRTCNLSSKKIDIISSLKCALSQDFFNSRKNFTNRTENYEWVYPFHDSWQTFVWIILKTKLI